MTHHRKRQLVRVQTYNSQELNYISMVQLRENLDFPIEVVKKFLFIHRFVLDHLNRDQPRFIAVLCLVLALEHLAKEAFADLFVHRYALARQLKLFDGCVQQKKAFQRTAAGKRTGEW